MVFFNYTTMQMTAKIVYYGPGLCGKTTNLQSIHQKTAPNSRGEMISLETETDRTLFFDLLPIEVGVIGGMKVRLQLYTVPGQVFYNATRKLVLKGVDGIVFVADSQTSMLDSNIESLRNLQANLAELNLGLDQVPIVFQYNKRDIRSIVPVDKLNEVLNHARAPWFEAAALHGIGVFETLKSISKLGLSAVRRKVVGEDSAPAVRVPPPAAPAAVLPPAAPPTPVPASRAVPSRPRPARPVPGPAPADPLAALVADAPRPGELPVEFAEEDTDKKVLRRVETKGSLDITRELEKIRTLTTSPAPPRPSAPSHAPSKGVEQRLQDVLASSVPEARQEMKRRAVVEIPPQVLKGSGELKIHIGFDGQGGEGLLRNALTVKLSGNPRLERLTLHLDLELKSKL